MESDQSHGKGFADPEAWEDGEFSTFKNSIELFLGNGNGRSLPHRIAVGPKLLKPTTQTRIFPEFSFKIHPGINPFSRQELCLCYHLLGPIFLKL